MKINSQLLQDLYSLRNKVALVTGGNSGLGLAMATALACAGAHVILAARREAELVCATNVLRDGGARADCLVADLSEPLGASGLGRRVIELYGNVDILINAAGVNLREPFEDVTPSSWQRQLNLHLAAPFFLSQVLAPIMQKSGWGRIINVASLQSTRAFSNSAPYGAAKGGIVQLTRAMAERWSPYGVTCNAIGPGFFPTPLTDAVFSDPELSNYHAERTCVGRNGKLEDLYGATIFLASDASAYITGQTIMVDGGYTAR